MGESKVFFPLYWAGPGLLFGIVIPIDKGMTGGYSAKQYFLIITNVERQQFGLNRKIEARAETEP